jgi:hypothetical protein
MTVVEEGEGTNLPGESQAASSRNHSHDSGMFLSASVLLAIASLLSVYIITSFQLSCYSSSCSSLRKQSFGKYDFDDPCS